MTQTHDEGMKEIRAIRHAISRDVGHDPKRYREYLAGVEKRYPKQFEAGRRLLRELAKGKRAATHR